MKIFRGPKTTDSWQETDTKSVEAWMSDWQPGRKLRFDGTIDKSGDRHTDIGVEVSEQDIIFLHTGLVKYYKRPHITRFLTEGSHHESSLLC